MKDPDEYFERLARASIDFSFLIWGLVVFLGGAVVLFVGLVVVLQWVRENIMI